MTNNSVAVARWLPLLIITCFYAVTGVAAEKRPNILLILVDDLGFSDLGAFGGEIFTPNLDEIAFTGVRMTNLHTTPTCSPTRAELLTGIDHHLVGLANMDELTTESQRGRLGYLGHLDPSIPTIAERLSDAGYWTVMSGKWHLGKQPEHGPYKRGFQQVFTLIEGGHNHFGKLGIPPKSLGGANYREHGEPVSILDNFYSSDYFTDKLIEFIDVDDESPFFAYLSFTAPHWPLQAPAESIANYRGRYDAGWKVLRRKRLERQIELGLLSENSLEEPPNTLRDWESLSKAQRNEYATMMEIYAGMVERLDWNVGRIVSHLKSTGELENTVIVFLSDNGAAPDLLENMARKVPDFPEVEPGSASDWGGPNSFLALGPNWAQAATAPHRLYKSVVTEGGLISPVIIYSDLFRRGGDIVKAYATVRDIKPTLLELAGVKNERQPEKRLVVGGTSMVPVLMGEKDEIHSQENVFGWELFGQRSIRRGNWKIVYVSKPNGSGAWELYDLQSDRSERHDLSKAHPKIFDELMAWWKKYETQMQIILEEQVVSPYNTM